MLPDAIAEGVQELGCVDIPCPCGCGRLQEQHDGAVRVGTGGGFFRAVVVRDEEVEPIVWIAIVTKSLVPEKDTRDWLATFRCDQLGIDIGEPDESPVAPGKNFSGHYLSRAEILAIPGAPEMYFRCVEAIMVGHSRLLLGLWSTAGIAKGSR